MKIESIILAAGFASRFKFKDRSYKKFLLPFERSTILNYIIVGMINAGISKINLIVDENADISEINSVTFLDSTISEYTNFSNQDLLIEDSSLNFEVELDAIDVDEVSDFQVILNYQVTSRTWQQKDFSWFSNDAENGKSYWQIQLENNTEISNGDNIEFYISASDYTGIEYLDDNSGNNYEVAIESNLSTQTVVVSFSLDLNETQAYSVSLQGNMLRLWSLEG